MRFDIDTVGDWSGEEASAVENLERISDAIISAAGEDYDERRLDQVLRSVFDYWGSRKELLTITDDQIKVYVKRVL